MITSKEFIKLWNQAESVAEVAKQAGMTKPQCSAKAFGLRKAGEKLKKFHAGQKAKVSNRQVPKWNPHPARLRLDIWSAKQKHKKPLDAEARLYAYSERQRA